MDVFDLVLPCYNPLPTWADNLLASLARLRQMLRQPVADIAVFCTHDPVEFVAMSAWSESDYAPPIAADDPQPPNAAEAPDGARRTSGEPGEAPAIAGVEDRDGLAPGRLAPRAADQNLAVDHPTSALATRLRPVHRGGARVSALHVSAAQ